LRLREPANVLKAAAALHEATRGAVDIALPMDAVGGITMTPTEKGLFDRRAAMLDRAVDVIAGRAKDLGIAGVERDGADRIRILLPGVADASRLVAMLGSRARLELRLIDSSMSPEQALETTVPLEDDVLYGAKDKLPYLVSRKVELGGEDLVEASPTVGARNEPAVAIRFGARGARAFAEVTRENVGRPFAIVLDGVVISAPMIREPILGGSGIINGRFTVQEANELAILLRSGALPLRLDVVEQQVVAAGQTH